MNSTQWNYTVLGVIPARSGSKGIPNKNIYPILGKPLISYTIEAALNSKHLTHCVVSTDSAEIADIASRAGALIPCLRPAELATDTARSLPVVLHALEVMEERNGREYDAVVMLQPTTPLRLPADIDMALEKLFHTGADSVISVVNVGGMHPLRMKRMIGDRLINYIDQGYEDMRPRQELPAVFIRNGAIYAAKRSVLLEQMTFSGTDCRAYGMPAAGWNNDDTTSDILLAKHFLSRGITQGDIRGSKSEETRPRLENGIGK